MGKTSGLVAKGDLSFFDFNLNSVNNHTGYPIVVSTNHVEKLGYNNRFENNGEAEVLIDSQKAVDFGNNTVSWKGFVQRVPYLVKGQTSNNLIIKSGLKLEAGVILKMMPGSGISVLPDNLWVAFYRFEPRRRVVHRGGRSVRRKRRPPAAVDNSARQTAIRWRRAPSQLRLGMAPPTASL